MLMVPALIEKPGVIFLDDDLDDWKKTYERGSELQFDSGQPDFFNGDSSRALKTTATAATPGLPINWTAGSPRWES